MAYKKDTRSAPLRKDDLCGLASDRWLVLIGLMGAGKSSLGKFLALGLGRNFVDLDQEIERQETIPIVEIFARFGEDRFRQCERAMLATILTGSVGVLATGGGAFMCSQNRAIIARYGVSIWLRAELDLLVERATRKIAKRPLLQKGEPKEILAKLMAQRYPVYGEADIVVDCDIGPHERIVEKMIAALVVYQQGKN